MAATAVIAGVVVMVRLVLVVVPRHHRHAVRLAVGTALPACALYHLAR